MNYEVVSLEEKIVAGVAARTSNDSPEMGKVIGGLWQKLFAEGIFMQIKDVANEKSIGLYTDYAGSQHEEYMVVVGREVKTEEQELENIAVTKIPAGNYAKFIVRGDVQKDVAKLWEELPKMGLARTYVCDFEEYQDGDMEQAEIHIYIGIE